MFILTYIENSQISVTSDLGRLKIIPHNKILWVDLIKPGGVISGHDYDQYRHPEVNAAVNDLLGKENIEILPGHVWYMEIQ